MNFYFLTPDSGSYKFEQNNANEKSQNVSKPNLKPKLGVAEYVMRTRKPAWCLKKG